jgi:hypothetical protein
MLCYGQLAPPLTLSCLFRFQGKRESGKVVESDDNGIQFMGENTSNPSEAVKAGNTPKVRKPRPSKTAADGPAQPVADGPVQPAAAPRRKPAAGTSKKSSAMVPPSPF